MKSLMLLWQEVANELGDWCRTSTIRDYKTVTRRYKHEGPSFLTITLPTLGVDLQKGLDRGYFAHDLFQGFSWTGGLPRFLGGFLELVFDRGTGLLLDSPSVDAVFAIRQLTMMAGKLGVQCSDARVDLAMEGYVKNERIVRDGSTRLTPTDIADFRHMSLLLWGRVLSGVETDIEQYRLIPKHGPGSTADGLSGNGKFRQREWTQRLEGIYPMVDYLIPNHGYYHGLDRVTVLEPGMERPVKVTPVPKTMKKPRIIAKEPTCMMYAQQALSESLVYRIRHDNYMGTVVGFDELEGQLPNRNLAKQGSRDGSLATLDLSDASDRVSNQLVNELTHYFPSTAEGLQASRSRKADVPGYGVIRLSKFASMGSALCFPIEAMVFTTAVFLGIQQSLKRSLTLKDVKSLRGQVRVYGDDIIVPTHYVLDVIERLEALGFLVNSSKSFWTGRFRESCGGDYYSGHDVTVVRARSVIPSLRRNVHEVVASVALRNRFYGFGMWRTARYMDSLLKRIIPFPSVLPTSPVLGRWSLLGFETDRVHRELQSPLVKGYVVSNRIPSDILEDEGALLKCLLKRGDQPFADRRHLERSGRPAAVDIKLRWASSV